MLLAIETSTRTGSVALLDGDRVVAYRMLPEETNKHGALLAPAVASIPELDLEKLGAYAIGIGPGSFTGLRIGLAFLKGLALVFPRPVVAVSTLEVIAARVFDEHPGASCVLPILDARRHEAYAALFRREGAEVVADEALPEGAYPVAELAPRVARALREGELLVAAGDGVLLEHGAPVPWVIADRAAWCPDARVLGRRAAARWARGEVSEVQALEPVYHQLAPGEIPAAAAELERKSNVGPGR